MIRYGLRNSNGSGWTCSRRSRETSALSPKTTVALSKRSSIAIAPDVTPVFHPVETRVRGRFEPSASWVTRSRGAEPQRSAVARRAIAIPRETTREYRRPPGPGARFQGRRRDASHPPERGGRRGKNLAPTDAGKTAAHRRPNRSAANATSSKPRDDEDIEIADMVRGDRKGPAAGNRSTPLTRRRNRYRITSRFTE